MGVYDRQIAMVKRLIDKYGQSVTITRIPEVIADPSKPWEITSGTPLVNTLKIVFVDPNATGIAQLGKEMAQYLKGSEVVTGKLRGLMANNNFVPLTTDIVNRAGKELKISAIDILAPNEQTILYTLEFDL